MNPNIPSFNPSVPPQRQQQVRIQLNNTQPVVCSKCGGQVFAEGVVFRKVSRLLTGQPDDGVMPIPAFYCVKCQEPLEEMLPDELKEELNKGKIIS